MRNQYRTLFEVYSENIQSVAPSSILDKIDTDVAHMKAIKVTNQWSLDFIKYKEYYKKYLINRAKKENFFDNENRINVDDMWEVYSDSTEERMREELIDYVGDEAVDRVIDQEQIDEEVDDNFYKDFQANYLPEIKAEYEKKYNDIIMKPSKELGIDIDIEEAYQQIVSESRDPSDSPDLVKSWRGAVVRLCDSILGIKDARVVNDIIKYLEEVVGPSLSYDGYASGVMQRYVSKYINKNAGSGFYLDQHLYDNMNLEHGYWPPRIKKAIVDSFKQMFKEYTAWKKIQEVLKKGSEEAGMEIDIEEAFSWDDYNYDFGGFKLTDKIKDWKHIDLFYKWLYLNLVNDPSFNSSRWLMYPEELDNITKKLNYYYEHEYHLNMLRVAPLHVKDYISNSIAGYHLRGIYVKVKNKFPEVAKDAEKVTIDHIKSLYDKWLKEEKIKNKTKRIIKKGSEKTGIDIDIEENNEPYSDLNSSYIIFPYFKVIHNWKDKDEFTEWLYKEIDIKPDMFGSESKNWTHAQMVAVYFDDACDQSRQYYYKVIADDDEVNRKVYEDALKVLKEYYKDFKQWKKTQEVLKKGSKEAGMEIDIEESNNSILLKRSNNEHDYGDIYSLVKHWEDGDMFIKWLFERTGDWPRCNKDNPLQEWWDNTVNRFSLLDPNRYNKKKRTVEDNIELALTSIEFFYDEFVNTDHYLKTKAAQDVLNKGLKETGIDI
jgi:hypothetical protein